MQVTIKNPAKLTTAQIQTKLKSGSLNQPTHTALLEVLKKRNVNVDMFMPTPVGSKESDAALKTDNKMEVKDKNKAQGKPGEPGNKAGAKNAKKETTTDTAKGSDDVIGGRQSVSPFPRGEKAQFIRQIIKEGGEGTDKAAVRKVLRENNIPFRESEITRVFEKLAKDTAKANMPAETTTEVKSEKKPAKKAAEKVEEKVEAPEVEEAEPNEADAMVASEDEIAYLEASLAGDLDEEE